VTSDRLTQFRHELKYEITLLEYGVLQKKLSIVLKPDPFMYHKTCYNVRSLYFDDQQNSALLDKESGVFQRKKYRIRIYNRSDDFIKFERKTKIGAYMLKESTRITRKEADKLIAGNCDFLSGTQDRLLNDFYLENRCNMMRPVVIVEYDREAYIHPIGKVRVTFDKGLRTAHNCLDIFNDNLCLLSIFQQQGIVLEVKYNEVLPRYIRGLFPDTIRPQQAIGKFVICRNQQMNQKGVL
jgi:hypothetical protein